MACDDQKNLSDFIKKIHSNLRNDANILGADKAWEIHCKQKSLLKQYASSMQELATKYWDKNSEDDSKSATSRINWIEEQCKEYFPTGQLYQRQREINIMKKVKGDDDFSVNKIIENHNTIKRLQLLDVGSCYNPFKNCDLFDVVAIDLAPANDSVYTCDFLNVNCIENCILPNDRGIEITALPINTFDIVVFSLLLEYIPSSDQRLHCCQIAYKLLKVEGILIIVTPDSKHVGANAKLMKSWRYSLACLGFMRVKYEKLPHIHCLVFRKCIYSDVSKRWANMHKNDILVTDIKIPQDLSNETNSNITQER